MTIYNPNNLIGNPKLDAKISEAEETGFISDEDYLYSASYQDCTGLTPTPAHNEFEAESYQELFHYLPPLPPNSSQNHGRTTDDIHLETRHKVTEQTPKSRYDYP